ncbi:hypothetical protein RHGRI_025868 [Rhododendron griersonianum]|uniref:Transposase MuDR plant domain-containing protein n=1 Tax=Rhododendron griersonianum TaxID=479676 RepID=A0AAV6IQV4_9ERIC|nr:hypothetical protein RHGRI_025868 [Rhododendron griersonianum]
MVWCVRDKGGGPPEYDRCVGNFTIKMHYNGRIEGTKYVGGSFGFVDYCHEDEISFVEYCSMTRELGQSLSNDYYLMVNGKMKVVRNDIDALRACQLVDRNRLVNVYAVCNIVEEVHVDEVVGTQCSQNLSKKGRRNEGKGKEQIVHVENEVHVEEEVHVQEEVLATLCRKNVSKRGRGNKSNAKEQIVHVEEEVHVQEEVLATLCSKNVSKRGRGNKGKAKEQTVNVEEVYDEFNDSDSDDYDPDSMSSESDDDYFDESDGAIEEDDELFDINVDKEVKDFGVPCCSYPESERGGVDIAPIDDGSDDTEELDSPSESDTDDDLASKGKKKKKKNPIFNEKTDLLNPVFSPGMEFKTHAIFRDAVKEHAVKLGRKIKFKKSDTKKVQAMCEGRKDCPWFIYGAFVKGDGVFRVKHYVEWTVHVDRQKVFRARRKALALLEGNAAEQFRNLFGYIEEALNLSFVHLEAPENKMGYGHFLGLVFSMMGGGSVFPTLFFKDFCIPVGGCGCFLLHSSNISTADHAERVVADHGFNK